MRFVPFLAFLMACPPVVDNSSPWVNITQPRFGAMFRLGREITATAQVGDNDHALSDLRFEFLLDGEVICSGIVEGLSLACRMTLPEESTGSVIAVVVEDPAGGVGDASVGVTFFEPFPPSLQVLPLSYQPQAGSPVELAVNVNDIDSDMDQLRVSWVSDLDGPVAQSLVPDGNGRSAAYVLLSEGLHTLRAEVVDNTGRTDSDVVGVAVLSPNAPPPAPVIELPSNPTTADNLVPRFVQESVDPDGQGVTYDFVWRIGSETVEFPVLDHTLTERNRTATLTVTPRDHRQAGPSTEVSVRIGNATPRLLEHSIRHPQGAPTGPYTCRTSWEDADLDEVSETFEWTDSTGTVLGTDRELTVPAPDDELSCTVLLDDGHGGTHTQTATLQLGNTAPVLVAATISPTNPTALDPLIAADNIDDNDGDDVAITYDWFVNGTLLQSGDSSVLDPGQVVMGDRVSLRLRMDDGTDVSVGWADDVYVHNAPPTEPVVAFDAAVPQAGDALHCLVEQPAVDPDGFPVRYEFVWTSEVAGSETISVWPDDTIPPGVTTWVSEWTCTVTAYDVTDAFSIPGSTTREFPNCDSDRDGYASDRPRCGGTDCDDDNNGIYPFAYDTPDGIDDNCDGIDCPGVLMEGDQYVVMCAEPSSLAEAQAACVAAGYDGLLQIVDEPVNPVGLDLLPAATWWMGLTTDGVDWFWDSGAPFSYTAWDADQPDGNGTAAAIQLPAATWTTADPLTELGFICQTAL